MNPNRKRYWLCDKCEGWGEITWNTNKTYPHDPQCEESEDCIECDGSGVIEVSYIEAEKRGLRPWGESTGRIVEGVRAAKRRADVLILLSKERAAITARHPFASRFYYDSNRKAAYKPVSLPKPAAAPTIHPIFDSMFRSMGLTGGRK